MAVTTSPTYHQGSPVHDGFATIRSSRNRLKARNLADFPITPAAKEQKHAEYFTIRRSNRQSFLDANSHVVNGADSGVVMNTFANSKHVNGVVGSTNGTDIRPILRKSLTFNESDFSRENADRRSCSTRDSTESTEQTCDHTTKDSVDALNDMQPANYSKSPQKFATLNMRRPRSIDLRSTCLEQPFRRNGFYSEPNTPVSPNGYEIYRNTGFPSSNESTNGATAYGSRPNGFQRSVSENNGFLTLGRNNGLRHSFTGSRPKESFARVRPHKCCECVTGVPHEEVDAAVGRRTLDTLYETQDPKVGCQMILRPKPPVPWWELAIKKSRYKSCPNFDEAHVVSAFEQSLSNMTQRLHQLTATAERKDSELTELRQTIELLRKQSIQAGLTTAHMQSMGISPNIDANVPGEDQLNSSGGLKSSPQHRSGGPNQVNNGSMTRHLSTDSVSSLSSGSSAATDKKHKKKGWLRSSFTKAFSRNAKISKTAKHSSLGQLSSQDSSSMGSQQNHYDDPHTIREGSNENSLEHSHELLATDKPVTDATASDKNGEKPAEDSGIVDELKRQLREKDLVLTDIRLEALSSAHQLESLKDTVIKMRSEMMNLKQNNERLQRLVTSRSLTGSQSSLGATAQSGDDPRRYSLADQATLQHQSLDVHSQSLDLDFSCLTSTPTLDFASKLSPSCQQNDIYGKVNGCGDVFSSSGLNGRMSATDCDINTVLPPPKSRELAIGESYSDIGITDNQGDASDGKKISIAVYLGQPETFPRYFEEQQDTMTEAEFRFYAKRSSSMFNNHHTSNFDSPRASHVHSPESVPEQDFQNRSNTNSLKSNKSTRSFKTHCNCEPTNTNEFTIAYTYISGKTTWQNLDYTVRKTFKDFLSRIDPGTNLGLNTDSITSYHLGEATRGPEISFPDLLPCGYIIGTVKTLYICLQGVGSLAFDSLIPKNIVYRYISLLSEHRRVILCGPSGTGKSYLAARLAEFYVQKIRPRANPAEAVATFNVDHKTAKELRQYLVNIAEQCNAAEEEELRSGMADPLRGPANGDNMSDTDSALPAVIILDNLHHASALGEAFSGLLTAKANRLPVIIGTMSQATCNTTNLQLHHNFRWLLTANHMEPVKGFLARYLRRKLFAAELSRGHRDPALGAVLEWLPGVWQTLNAFLEQHSSSDVTIGPRLFLACPMDVDASQAWFADVWNYSVVPYVSAAAREGVALYGRRPRAANSSGSVSGAGDPLVYVKSSYPWLQPNNSQALRGIALEDIGLDTSKNDSNMENNEDPLLNMLMRLQEAANYGGNQSQDSDNASIDSNLHDNSADNDM